METEHQREESKNLLKMKLLKTTFTNESFFSRYAPLVKILAIVSLIGQLVSGTTESIIIYSTSLMNFEKMLGPDQAHTLAIVITILGVAIIELGLFVLLPISIQAFLYKRFKGLDLLISVFVIPACLFLMCIGTVMSFKGSEQIVSKGFGQAEQVSTLETENKYDVMLSKEEVKVNDVISQLNKQKASTLQQLQASTDTKVQELSQELSQIGAKEKRTGESFITSKERVRKQISQAKADHQKEHLSILQKYDSMIQEKQSASENKIASIEKKRDAQLDGILADNKRSKLSHDSNIGLYGALLGYLNIVMVFILLVSNIIREAHHKGSGIESKVIVSDSYFQENVILSFIKALFLLIDTKLREFVNWIESKTPDTPQPIMPQSLINRKELNQISITVEPRNRIGFNRHEKTHEKTPTSKQSETNTSHNSFEYVNTLRDLNKYKKRLASHKQKARAQARKNGFILDRTSNAISNNTSKVQELSEKLKVLIQMTKQG